MRIVLLGPQGAGKGTQAQRISRETGAKHISTGDLVPDEIIVEMMRPYLDEADSWILDGFPRNESQAEALDKMLEEIDAELDAAVALEAPDELLVERLSGRRTSEATGRIYHV